MFKRLFSITLAIVMLTTGIDTAVFNVTASAEEENYFNQSNDNDSENLFDEEDDFDESESFDDENDIKDDEEETVHFEEELEENEDEPEESEEEFEEDEEEIIELLAMNSAFTSNVLDISEIDFDDIINGDIIISATTTISDVVLYTGNVTIDANVTVSPSAFVVVLGDVNIDSGSFIINGEVYTFRDFRIQSKDANGNFGVTAGWVSVSANAKLTVYGDFYTQSTASSAFRFGTSNSMTSPSILELHGNFSQIGTNTIFMHHIGFKLIFAGDGEQRISMERLDGFVNLGRIEVTNAKQTLYLDSPVYTLDLLSDVTIIGDVDANNIRTNSHNFKIIGDLIVSRSMTLSTGDDFTVTGEVYIQNGVLLSLNNNLTVEGNFRIQSKDANGNFGATTGRLFIGSAKLTVYGDFYTQSTTQGTFGGSGGSFSTLELHGSFTQIGTNTFFNVLFTTNHKTIFAGDGEQRISMERLDGFVNLGRIEVTNAKQTIFLDTPVHSFNPINSFAIIGDLEVSSIIGNDLTFNINGSFIPRNSMTINHFLNITGNAIIDSTITLNRDMKIGGDLRIQKPGTNGTFSATTGNLTLNSGVNLAVLGNFYTQTTTTANFGGGTVTNPSIFELQGSFYQIGTTTNFRHAFNGLIIKLSGTGNQYISFDNYNQSNLSRLNKTNANDVYFLTPILSLTVESDIAIAMSNDARIGTLNAGGNVVHLKTPAVLTTVNFGGGVLICNENIILNGRLNFNGGLLNARKNVTISSGGFLNMLRDDDIVIVQGDLIFGTTSAVTLNRGFLDLKGNLTFNSAIRFTTGANFYAQLSGEAGQRITYPQNGSVLFANLAVPGLNPQHAIA
ncbi:MAG: hypothetical protein LBC86_06740, partial [Oscillospiraceae bacterium]|nr:hypothetical protein [Oscillospiraceae bacterium]